MFVKREKPSLAGGGLSVIPIAAGSGVSENNPPRQNKQDKFRAHAGGELTCASMRMAELRDALMREISRTIAIALQAQAALFDGDDAEALAVLRRHWVAMRADIAPMAAELSRLSREAAQ